MADNATTSKVKTDAPVVKVDDYEHDRVVMLSLRADGTPDQNNPELIGDKDQALAAAKEQFAQKAVSAADQRIRSEHGLGVDDDGDTSDAAIDAVKAEHDKIAEAAEKRAEAVVNALHQG